MPAFLVPVDAGQCLIPLEKAIVMIGRQADCDVSLTHSRKISRRHCCIAQVNNTFIVRDLGSTNGVYLNGKRIEKEALITMGDDLVIGDVRFTLSDEIPVAASMNSSKRGTVPTSAAQGSAVVPPIPSPLRNSYVPPIPKVPEVDSDEFDDDVFDDDSSKAPNTLEGIRRFRKR